MESIDSLFDILYYNIPRGEGELIVQIGDLLILKFFYVRSYYDAEGGCGGTIWLEQLVWQAW